MLGNFHDNVINIECKTSSADLYVVDAEGVYIENIAMHSYLESDIIDAINAKYGTNFTHLTMLKVTDIAIGDDCTNWNAYEKIEMPIPYYAVTTGGSNRFAAGYLVDKVWHVYFSSNNMAWGIDNTGLIVNEMGGMGALITNLMLPKMRDNGIEVESYVQYVVDWNVGETIPNVEQYTFIT